MGHNMRNLYILLSIAISLMFIYTGVRGLNASQFWMGSSHAIQGKPAALLNIGLIILGILAGVYALILLLESGVVL